ncbi:MAG TPA: biopolymer transporter ExbD [Phycisphaerales bacterium]|nr:biopolymer transporter ExbD [Phycisphaerales bacterium]
MFRRFRTPAHEFHGINVTPMIDVVMCLIIFFLVVGNLATTERAKIRLPRSAEGEEIKAEDRIVINVFRPTGAPAQSQPSQPWPARVTSDDREFSTAQDLESFVRTRIAANPECAVEIRADRFLPYGWVQPTIIAVARAGATTARLATERAR